MKEFNLSEKRHEVWEDEDDIDEHGTFHYPEEDVKEFIKLDFENLMLLVEKKIDWLEYILRRKKLAGGN